MRWASPLGVTDEADCRGTLRCRFEAHAVFVPSSTRITSGVHPGLVLGALVERQWSSRDPLDPAGFGRGLSNALSFGIAP